MSTLMSQARTATRGRVPRFAEAAVERARLTVVPQRALGRTQAARTPFAVLVLALLVAGVVGLLMFNTHMQQASFQATALQTRVDSLTAKQQSLTMQLDELRNPQRLAVAAKKLGMVAPAEPAFIRLSDGRILGNPTPATSEDAVRINPLPAPKPPFLAPKPYVVRVPAATPVTPATTSTKATKPVKKGAAATTSGSTGAASQGGTR